jgi:uncharacterized protein
MTEEEAAIMSQHFLYMKDLLDKGRLIVAGPEESGKFGVSIFEADSLEHAKEIAANDPVVKNNIMSVEVYPYRVSFIRNPSPEP